MNKVLIYPYSDEIAFLLEGNYFNDDIDVRELVGLKGSKYIGKTIECANKKLTVRDNFENHLNKVDTVWFVDSMEKERNELDFSICNKIEKCIELNKTIWYSRKKVTKTEEEFIKQHKDRLSKYDSDKKMKFRYKRGNPLIRIETPIVLVCGLLESTGKLKFLLNLKKIVEKEGYKISAIGTRDYCEMLDMYSFPKFMTNKIREVDKIVAFNNYVRHIEYIDKPDLILIGIPGGVNTYSQEIFSDFGMMACEVLRAVKPDCSVLCTPCYLADLLEVEMSIKEIEGRLGINIDYILMDNKIICANESERYKEIRFLTVDEKEVLTQLKQYNKTNYFSAVSESNKVAKYVLEQLGKYGTVQTI